MLSKYEATSDFENNVIEIQILISLAKEFVNDFKKYALFNKASIILLCTKFETFLENFLKEYAYINLTNFNNQNVDEHIYEHILRNHISKLNQYILNKGKREKHLDKVVNLCSPHQFDDIQELDVVTKFSYGKHGQTEIEKLLNEFGLCNILAEEIKDVFFNKFNSLNFIRNNIIHEDATPSLTHVDVEDHLSIILNFIKELDSKAIEKYNTAYNSVYSA